MPHAQPDRTEWDSNRTHWRGRVHAINAAAVGLPRARWHNVQRLIRAVLWFDQRGHGCYEGADALVAEADLSHSSIGRAKRDATDLGLLTVERRNNPGPHGGRLPDLLRVDLERLAAFDPASRESSADEAATASTEPTRLSVCEVSAQPDEATRHIDEVNGQPDEANGQSDAYIKEEPTQPPTQHPPQPPPRLTAAPRRKRTAGAPPGGDGPRRTAWAVVEGELFQLGVNQSRAAVRDARAGGLTPAEAHAIVAHWRPRRDAWGPHGPAVLRRRFARARPGEPPHEGWPAYADVHGAQRDDADPATKRAVAEAHRRDAADERRRRAAREARLERYLPLLDDLSREERAALGAEARRRQPDLCGKRGEEVVRQGVLPLLEEWGEAGLTKWRASRKAAPSQSAVSEPAAAA